MLSRRGGFESFSRWLSERAALRLKLGATILGLLVGSLAVVLLVPGIPDRIQEQFANVVTIVVALAVPLTCGWAASRAHGRTRAAWWLMAAAGASWLVGEILWLLETYVLLTETAPAPSDAFYLLALLPAAIALVLFPAPLRAGPERNRMLLAAVVVAGAVLFISRSLALAIILPAATGPWLSQAVYIAYPTADVVLASLALIVLLRSGSQSRLHLVLLAVGFLCYTIADTLYLLVGAVLDEYSAGSLLDLGWVAGYALFALAALVPYASVDVQERPRSTRVRVFEWSSLALYVPLLAAVVVASSSPPPKPDSLLIVTGIVTLLTFAAHQALLAGDHARLRTALESQVGQLKVRRAELRQLASQNERIVQSVVDGVFGVDACGLITFVNPQAVAMLGRSAEDLLGRPESLLFADLPGASSRAAGTEDEESAVSQALASGTVVSSGRARFTTGDGTTLPVELAVGPIVEEGRITGAVVVFRDVSARLAVEKMKDEFVSVVSHELRTPLTSIRGSLGLLAGGMGGELSAQGAKMVKIALDSSERLTRLISDMLDLERMESGSLTIVPIICEVRPLVNTALNEVEDMSRQYGVQVSATRIDGIVSGDADRIVQTLTNVLGNSIKFSPRGGTVTVSTSQQGEMVEFAIADRGRGIPADRIGRIFERFEQVDSSDSRVRGGTGLGLPISRDIITLHGGSIWVESELGKGSVFRFTLPGTVRPTSLDESVDDEVRQRLDGVVT